VSPAAQFAAVATLTFAILGFQIVALGGLGAVALLTWYGFRAANAASPAPAAEDPAPPPAATPEEALRRDG
jgi:hypothetical protein